MVEMSGALLSIAQFIFIFYLLFSNKWQKALIYHFVFWACSISVANASAMFEGNHDLTMYNYCRLELYGPLKFSYIISVILFFRAMKIVKTPDRESLFFKLYKTMKFLLVSGSILGTIGFITDSNYSIDGCITYGMYIALVVMSLYTLLKFDSIELKSVFFSWGKAVLIASVYSVAILFALGFRSAYSTQETIVSTDMWYYASILIPGFFVIKERLHCLLAITLLVPLNLFSAGGKTILILGIVLLFFAYNCFFIDNTLPLSEQKTRKSLRLLCIIALAGVLYSGILSNVSSGELTQNKTNDVLSLFSLNVNEMGRSPAIRMATLMNILYNNRYNPIAIMLGNGYGGYFTDELNLFNGLDVWQGGWPEAVCKSGIYPSGHDTFASVPLVNGLWGLFILIRIAILYLRSFRKSFLVMAVVPWLFLTFYANINYAYIAIFLLYAATFQLDSKQNSQVTI